MKENANVELIRSQCDTIILKSLLNEDKYGLLIMNEITEKSKGLFAIKQATLYNNLKRLEKEGLISSYPGKQSNGAKRTYYSITDEGREKLEREKLQWEFSRTIMNGLLSNREFDPATDTPPIDVSDIKPLTKRKREHTAQDGYEDGGDNYSPESDEISETVSAECTTMQNYSGEVKVDAELIHPRASNEPPAEDNRDGRYYAQPRQSYELPAFNDSVNYMSAFNDLYSKPRNTAESKDTQTTVARDQEFDVSEDMYSMNALKVKMSKSGYTVKPYVQSEATGFYSGNYYFVNKIFLVFSVIMFALLTVEALGAFFILKSLYNSVSVRVLALYIGLFAVAPFCGAICYVLNRDKKRYVRKTNTTTLYMVSIGVVLYIIIVALILAFFALNVNMSMESDKAKYIFTPVIFSFNAILAVFIYDRLFKSKRFHLA